MNQHVDTLPWNVLTSISMLETNLFALSIYRPPSNKNGLMPAMFFNNFSSLLENVFCCNSLICDNFNFHMDMDDNADTQHFNDLIESAAMVQHFDCVTHSKGNILDLIITQSGSDLISNLRTCMDLPSDHVTLT